MTVRTEDPLTTRIQRNQHAVHRACSEGANGKTVRISGYCIDVWNGSPASLARESLVAPLRSDTDIGDQVRMAVDATIHQETPHD